MKYGFYLVLTLCLVFGAYQIAQNKMERPLNLDSLRLGMTSQDIEKTFGTPSAESRNQFTYILHDGSELIITLREQKVSSAKVKFHRKIKIQDPEMKKLTLVQMHHSEFENNPSWFFAGKPEQGLIYKITSEGVIESLTWVPPFSYSSNQPKQLQALLQDFNSQRSL
jgi:outer membrane protein assembly factor BamE (lipoprotein component of BamABCDE complex)